LRPEYFSGSPPALVRRIWSPRLVSRAALGCGEVLGALSRAEPLQGHPAFGDGDGLVQGDGADPRAPVGDALDQSLARSHVPGQDRTPQPAGRALAPGRAARWSPRRRPGRERGRVVALHEEILGICDKIVSNLGDNIFYEHRSPGQGGMDLVADY
jgi:hypothetical protein